MEYQTIVIKDESDDPINPSEKSMEHELIVMEEGTFYSYYLDPRLFVSDKERFQKISVNSVVLCLLLIVFPALKLSLFGVELMAKYHTVMMVLLLAIVLLFQQYLLFTAAYHHPARTSIYPILYILLLSSTTSVIEVSFVSPTAAIIIFIFWYHTIASIVNINRQLIFNANKIVLLDRILKLILIICVISLALIFVYHLYMG